ncbi:MMPL family transporter [Nonomuraea sp. NPDC050556]|uniref:MMPL family transporter n=1 Tax=Nonomuraea sp. NPDC050556 TaxID=3364369 RepID=UPI0037BC685F
MERLTDFVLRHKLVVVLAWLAIAIAGIFATAGVEDRFTSDFGTPGRPAYEANQAIKQKYGEGGNVTPMVVVATGQADFAKLEPLGRVVADPAFVSQDGRTTYALLYPEQGDHEDDSADLSGQIIRTLQTPGSTVKVTGLEQLEPEGGGDGLSVVAEMVIGGVGALVVLAFVFGSLLALVPLVIALVAILGSFLAVYGLTLFTDISMFVQFIVALIGLGVAIDYSLLLITRWREEDHDVRRAMAGAGRAVLVSAATVAIGLVAMVVLPVPFLRSVGYGGMIVPLVCMLAVVTLLPILLATAGPRLDRRRRGTASGRWGAWARLVVRFRRLALAASTAVLLALGGGALGLNLGEPASGALATSGPAYEGLAMLRDAELPTGALTPVEVLAPEPALETFRSVPGVRAAVVAEPGLLTLVPDDEGGTAAGQETVKRVLAAAPGGARVGGVTAANLDFADAVYGSFPLMLGLIMFITFVVLARSFRSLVLALKAVVLNLLSLAAAMGAMVLVWQYGYGSELLWGISGLGAIDEFIPVMVFAFLYGLSMDYEVFILARMREEYDRSGSTTVAVVEGLGRTGRLVTSAALVLFLAFASLAAAPILQIKLFATALGIGILLDATVVRALLVPALVSVMGRWNWWLPGWAARVLRVQSSADQECSSALGSPHQPSGVSTSSASTIPK